MYDEIQSFVNWLRRRNPQARTWRDYGYDLKQFVAVVGAQSPANITFKDIDRFVTSQVANGFKPATVNRRLAAIMSLYTFLSDEIPDLVCPVLPHRHKLRQPKRLPRPVPETALQKFFAVISEEQFDAALCKRDRAMFLLMLRCGLRISEVAQLQFTDLYLDESPPRLLVAGKNSKERSMYVSPQALAALQVYLDERLPVTSTFVFVSYQGEGMSTTAIHKRLMRYRAAAGVDLTAHQLRHSFAGDLVAVDVPVTTIQKLMGHAWLVTTQTYIAANDHKVRHDFRSAVQALEGWQ